MGVAASRRAGSRFGDFAFSLLAAGLGLALLFATGRHLFLSPDVEQPARTLASGITTNAVLPALRRPAPVRARDFGSPAAPRSNLAPVRPTRARAANPERGGLRPAASTGTTIKPAAPQRATTRASAPAAFRGAPGAAQRTRPVVTVRNAVSPKAKPRAKLVARESRPSQASRPRDVPARVARPVTSRPHVALVTAANGAQHSATTAMPHRIGARGAVDSGTGARGTGARGAGVAERARIVGRRPAAHVPSIIEPPLGYDARPALVLAPGSAQLELGEVVLPTIRSKRRH